MVQTSLKDNLRSMVRQYGFEQVDQSLHEIELSDGHARKNSKQAKESIGNRNAAKSGKNRAKSTAPEYVAKMELPSQREVVVSELALRFEDKSFLPSFGDIVNFCSVYSIDVPASKSRVSAIPRVFKHLAVMELSEVQRILDDGMFSGPSRLGPIADAIRRNGRASRQSSLYLDTQ